MAASGGVACNGVENERKWRRRRSETGRKMANRASNGENINNQRRKLMAAAGGGMERNSAAGRKRQQ